MTYLANIKSSLLLFIATSFVVTLPIVIFQYRKNGYYDIKEAVITYLFVFYMQTTYLLAVLPLPDREVLMAHPVPLKEFIQLIPFSYIGDIKEYFQDHVFSLMGLLKAPPFYQALFNVVMLIPLGVFLRNRFQLSFKKVLLLGFLVSLFFEVTQLTGLYGIYNHPYRVFDVDDLINNTLGAVIGYGIAPVFLPLFPNREKQQKTSDRKNEKVSIVVQYLILITDTLLFGLIAKGLVLITGITFVLSGKDVTEQDSLLFYGVCYGITFLVLFVVIPLKSSYGRTVSMWFLKYYLYQKDGKKGIIIIRTLIFYGLYIIFKESMTLQGNLSYMDIVNDVAKVLFVSIHLYFIVLLIKRKKQTFFDRKLHLSLKREEE